MVSSAILLDLTFSDLKVKTRIGQILAPSLHKTGGLVLPDIHE